MDPLATLFAAILNTVTNSVHEHTRDLLGSDLKAEVVEYQGRQVAFQYQFWRIKAASVCENQREQLTDFSKCTQAAKSFFVDACAYLQENSGKGWKYEKYKNMYCSTSVSFKPTVASIVAAGEATPLEVARRECNKLIVEASDGKSPALIVERNRACEHYESLKQK